jgi:hypothetical protein
MNRTYLYQLGILLLVLLSGSLMIFALLKEMQ